MTRYKRLLPPAHYLVKVQSYKLLSKMEKYDTSVFEVAGYKWRLCFYPNGDAKNNGNYYISLYLEIAELESLPHNWEVYVNFKLFLYDQEEDSYLTIENAGEGSVKRFSEMKTTWGFPKLLSMSTFKHPSRGYLVNDSCAFGAEVLVVKPTLGNYETISFVEGDSISNADHFIWKIEEFSKLKEGLHRSRVFTVGGVRWELFIYPKGEHRNKFKSFSFYLSQADHKSHPTKATFYIECKLRVRDQIKSEHSEQTVHFCLNASSGNIGLGKLHFMPLEDLHKPSNGFIVDDTLIVEAEFMMFSETKLFPQIQNEPYGNQRVWSQSSYGEEKSELHHQVFQEISRSKRHLPPAHYSMQIQSYSSLLEKETFDSSVFEAQGYIWRLSFYPNGDKINGGTNHISLYLVKAETDGLPPTGGIHVDFKLFVYNQIEDKYLTIQDADETVKWSHGMKTKWGYAKLLPLETFKDPCNGYLVDDSCIFGVEVFILKHSGYGESFYVVKGPNITNANFSWKIENFSKLDKVSYTKSNVFTSGERTWYLSIHPNGESDQKGKSFSFFLCKTKLYQGIDEEFYAKFKLRVRDQVNGQHVEATASCWFSPSSQSYGFPKFMSVEDLRDDSEGFIVNDTLIVEVEFLGLSKKKVFFETDDSEDETDDSEDELC